MSSSHSRKAAERALARVSSFVNPETPKIRERDIVRIVLGDPATRNPDRIFWGTGLFEAGTIVLGGAETLPTPGDAWSTLVEMGLVHVACVIGIVELWRSDDVAFVCLLAGLEDRGPVAIAGRPATRAVLQTQLATLALLTTREGAVPTRVGTVATPGKGGKGARGIAFALEVPDVPGGIGALRARSTHFSLHGGARGGTEALVAQVSRWAVFAAGGLWFAAGDARCRDDLEAVRMGGGLPEGLAWDIDSSEADRRVALGTSILDDLRAAGVAA